MVKDPVSEEKDYRDNENDSQLSEVSWHIKGG
jgi:hypothetical protein